MVRFSSPEATPTHGYLKVQNWELQSDLNQLSATFGCVIPNAQQWFDQFGSTNLAQAGSKVELFMEDERKFVGWIIEDGIKLVNEGRDLAITACDAMWAVRNSIAKVRKNSKVLHASEQLTDVTSKKLIYESTAGNIEWSPYHIPVITRVFEDSITGEVYRKDFVQPSEYQIQYRFGLVFFNKPQTPLNYMTEDEIDGNPNLVAYVYANYSYFDLTNTFNTDDAIYEFLKYDAEDGGAGLDNDDFANDIVQAIDLGIKISRIDWEPDSGTFEDYIQFLRDSGLIPENYKIYANPIALPDVPGETPTIGATPLIMATPLQQQTTAEFKINHEIGVDSTFSLEDTFARIEIDAQATMGQAIKDITISPSVTGSWDVYDLPNGRPEGGMYSQGVGLWDFIKYDPPDNDILTMNLTDGNSHTVWGAVSISSNYPPDTSFPDRTQRMDQDINFVDIDLGAVYDVERVTLAMWIASGFPYNYKTGKIATADDFPIDYWGNHINNFYVSHHLPILSLLARDPADDAQPVPNYYPFGNDSMYFTLDPLAGGDGSLHTMSNPNFKQLRYMRVMFHAPWFVRVSDNTGSKIYRAAYYFLSDIFVIKRGIVLDYLDKRPKAEITDSTTGTPLSGSHTYPVGTVFSVSVPGIINVGTDLGEYNYSGMQICVPTPSGTPTQPYVGVINKTDDDLVYTETNDDLTGDALAAGVQTGDFWVINSLRYGKDISYNIRDFYRPKFVKKFENIRLPKKTSILKSEKVYDYDSALRLAISELWERIRNMDTFHVTVPYRPDINIGTTVASTVRNVITQTYMITSVRYKGDSTGVFVDIEMTNYNRDIE